VKTIRTATARCRRFGQDDELGADKKESRDPTNMTAKLSAACVSLGSVAAAKAALSVRMAMIAKATVLIQRSDTCGRKFSCAIREEREREVAAMMTATTKAMPSNDVRHNARPQRK